MQDLEDRVAQAESALNVAHAHIEDQTMFSPKSATEILSPQSHSSPQSQAGKLLLLHSSFSENEIQ